MKELSTAGHRTGTVSSDFNRKAVPAGTYRLRERAAGFLTLIRPIFFLLTPLNAGSAAVLALGGYPSLVKCLYGFFAVAFASCASNVFNDYRDRERDRLIWPDRPLPSGRVRPYQALLVVFISLAISFVIAWYVFNPMTFWILAIALLMSGAYSAYLRDRVGYLALPPLVGLIYLGGWAAFAPESLFSSWLPWYLYILGVAWQTAHIMVYYPLHLAPDTNQKAPRVFFFTPSPQTAVNIGVIFTFITFVLSIGLYFLAPLGIIYLALVILTGIWAMARGIRLLGDVDDRQKSLRAFGALSRYRMIISVAILLEFLILSVT